MADSDSTPLQRERTTSESISESSIPEENNNPETKERSNSTSDMPSPTRKASYTPRKRLSSVGSAGEYLGRGILVAVDASPHAKYAFEWFLENIHKPDDMIILVHCPEAPKLPTFSFKSGVAPPVDEWKKILDDMNTKTRKLEEDYEGTCIQKKLRYKVRGEAMKKPGEGIIKICEEERASMIAMGTRGLGTLKRALLGSVSEFVVRNTSVPVIIIPNKRKS